MNIPRSIKLLYQPYEIDDLGRKRLGAWSQNYSGTKYWIMDPLPEEVNLIDIVVGLSNAARYRGQTKFFYPVLTHCVLVSQGVERLALERGWSVQEAKAAAFEGLLHDASEAFLGDVARPLKRQRAMREYCRVEALWEEAINTRFGVKSNLRYKALVKEVDQRIVLDEIQTVMFDPDMWARSGRYVGMKPLGAEVKYMTQKESMTAFYNRYLELRK